MNAVAAAGSGPKDPAPVPGFPRVGFLAAFATGRPNVEARRYSYRDAPSGPRRFYEQNVLFHYAFAGPFCAIAISDIARLEAAA